MCTEFQLVKITDEITRGVKDLLGDKLRRIILYGSYARGDFDDESDIDIMVLADVKDEDIYPYKDKICDMTSDLGLDNNIMVSVFLKDNQIFNEYLPVLPFYQNILKDGVELYANK